MSVYLLYSVTELRYFITAVIGILFVLTGFVFYWMAGKKTGLGEFGIQSLFFFLTGRELVWLAAGICQLVYLAVTLFFPVSIGVVQLTALAFLCTLRALLELKPAAVWGEALYGVMMGVSLLASGLLKDYMEETGAEPYIAAIWGLLALFMVQYGLYYFLKSLERLLRARGMVKRKAGGAAGRRQKKEHGHRDETEKTA